jgi:hypothetical protein
MSLACSLGLRLAARVGLQSHSPGNVVLGSVACSRTTIYKSEDDFSFPTSAFPRSANLIHAPSGAVRTQCASSLAPVWLLQIRLSNFLALESQVQYLNFQLVRQSFLEEDRWKFEGSEGSVKYIPGGRK